MNTELPNEDKESFALKVYATQSDLDDLKKDYFDIRERLAVLRENDLFNLREQFSILDARFRLALIVGGILATALGIFGIKQYNDVNTIVTRKLQDKMDETLGYYDQESKALIMMNNGLCNKAIPVLKDLSAARPDDELVVSAILNCYDETESYDDGYRYLSELKAKSVFPKKFQTLWTFNNAGFLVLVKS